MRWRVVVLIALLFGLQCGAFAQNADSAKAFVESVYRDYANPDLKHQEHRQVKFYTAELYRLIAAGRKLVAYTSDHFRDQPLEQALWLRNLGVSLAMGGEPAEARSLLRRALELCQTDRESDQSPRAVCLLESGLRGRRTT